jgi:sugar phosphate isomerase/epimerase
VATHQGSASATRLHVERYKGRSQKGWPERTRVLGQYSSNDRADEKIRTVLVCYAAQVMNIGISTLFNLDLPLETVVPMVKKAGFDALSLMGIGEEGSVFLTPEGRASIKTMRNDYGITIDSLHAPLGYDIDVSSSDAEVRMYSVDVVKRTIDACTEIGCKIVCLHLSNDFEDPELDTRIKAAYESLDHLVPHARQHGVCIALENLFRQNSIVLFDHMLTQFQQKNIGVCYDSSHAQIAGDLFSPLERYGERIIAVHISDNRGQTDDHVLPYEGIIDWNAFARNFARINYTGTFLLEVDMQNSSLKEPKVFLDEAYKRAKKITSLLKKI